MGVVIGETTEIGDNVTIYQGATWAEQQGDRKAASHHRQYVIISAGAMILGPFRVGGYAKIGAGSVVLERGTA